MGDADRSTAPFDSAAYANAAIAEYLKVQSFYEDLADVIARALGECLKKRGIAVSFSRSV